MIARVALSVPIARLFDYRIPEELEGRVCAGVRVAAPLSGRREIGIVVERCERSSHDGVLDEIVEVFDGPRFSEESLAYLAAVCAEHAAPLGLVATRMLPVSARSRSDPLLALPTDLTDVLQYVRRMERRAAVQAGLLRRLMSETGPTRRSDIIRRLGVTGRQIDRLTDLGLLKHCEPHARPPALEGVSVEDPRPGVHLLGGDERRETYAAWIDRALSRGDQTLVLSPEVLHAAGLWRDLQTRLGDPVDLFHSALAEGARGEVWEKVRLGEARIVVGTRSALFLPFERLGLVILDEEQDGSYKQSEMVPYYQARDVLVRSPRSGRTILGAATPSLETQAAIQAGMISVLRASGRSVPIACELIDVRGARQLLSDRLIQAIEETLSASGRVLIGVGQAGFARAVVCRACGAVTRCLRCGTALSIRGVSGETICSVCGERPSQTACLRCGDSETRTLGGGSESIEDETRAWFPERSILRVDREVASSRDPVDIDRELRGDAEILIATPMIAKGPALPGVRLAAAVDADRLLATPDYRANERAIQYLRGLAGRCETRRLVIQTAHPESEILRAVAANDLEPIWARELEDREMFGYPPFGALARLALVRRDRARRRADAARILGLVPETVEVLGPVERTRGASETLYTLRARSRDPLVSLAAVVASTSIPARFDLDPERL